MKPAVIASCHTIGLAVIRSLGRQGVPCIGAYYDRRDMGQVSRYARSAIHIPHPEEHESAFLRGLFDAAEQLGPAILFPADDATLVTVSKHKQALQRCYTVACCVWSTIEKVIDKKLTCELAASAGVPIPLTISPDSLEEARAAAAGFTFPCLVKPRRSHSYFEKFRRKMTFVRSREELIEAYAQAASLGQDVMIQEYIPGPDSNGVNYNSYACSGETRVEFTAKKVRLSPPQFGIPRVVISRELPAVTEPGQRIVKALGYSGYSCIEFKKDARDGRYKLLDINARHNRSGLLAMQCGIDFPYLEYQHLCGGTVPAQTAYRSGIYWIDEFKDFTESIARFPKEGYSLADYVRPYLGPHVFAVFDKADMRPFIKRGIDIVKLGAGRIFKKK